MTVMGTPSLNRELQSGLLLTRKLLSQDIRNHLFQENLSLPPCLSPPALLFLHEEQIPSKSIMTSLCILHCNIMFDILPSALGKVQEGSRKNKYWFWPSRSLQSD